MNENIKKCVDARVDFFDKYYTVPENLKGQVDEFIEEIMEMKQVYEQDFFDSQTDSSWSDFDTGYQA